MDNTGRCIGRRGQISSAEVVIAFSLFVVALAAFFLAWNLLLSAYSEEQANHEMNVVLIGVSDSAVMSPGDPADWENIGPQKASSIGLARSRNVLSARKLQSLQANGDDYGIIKEKMGTGKFQVYLSVLNSGGDTVYQFGMQPDLENESVSAVNTERLALLEDGSVVRLRVQVWRTKDIRRII